MNKGASKQVSISAAIYKALDKRRQEEFSVHKMTGYIEEILNQFAHRRLIPATPKAKP